VMFSSRKMMMDAGCCNVLKCWPSFVAGVFFLALTEVLLVVWLVRRWVQKQQQQQEQKNSNSLANSPAAMIIHSEGAAISFNLQVLFFDYPNLWFSLRSL
jgi:hypothetical protein